MSNIWYKRISLLIFTVIICSNVVVAKNMYATHGNNFVYLDEVKFPICWDLRQGFLMLNFYRDYYLDENSKWPERFYREFLAMAYASGVNTLLIRDEPRLEAGFPNPKRLIARANTARALDLDVILGGIINSGGDGTGDTHNADVISTLQVYEDLTPPGLPGDWIAVHGFDEPDGQGLVLLDDFESVKNEVDLNIGRPFGTFLGYPAEFIPTLENPYTSMVYGASDAVTYSYWCNLDYAMFDWYPSLVWFSDMELVTTHAEIRGIADLVPSSGNYYKAYTSRDEVWAVTRESSSVGEGTISVFSVYNIVGETSVGKVSLQLADTLHIKTPWPFQTTSSTIQSNDCEDRSSNSHDLSSAVVCWNPGGELEPDARIVFSDGTDIIKDTFPGSIGAEDYSNVLFSIGELDYQTNRVPNGLCTGVIGYSDLRILWCGQEKRTGALAVSIFGKNSAGNDISLKSSLPDDISMQLPSGFSPAGAVWGRFWTDSYPHRRSGFILYDNDGDYVVVYNDVVAASETWLVSSLYQDLFGAGMEGSSLTAYRDVVQAHLTPAQDRILSVVCPSSDPSNVSLLHGSPAWDNNDPGMINIDDLELCSMSNFGYTECQDVKAIGYEIIGRSGPRFYFVDSNGQYKISVYQTGFPDECETIEYHSSSTWFYIGNLRSRHTKRAFADVLLESPSSSQTLSFRAGKTSMSSTAPGVSCANMFGDMCSEAVQASHGVGAFDLEFTYGVESTSESNALMANVQSFGRAMQSSIRTFPGSQVTGSSVNNDLLYLSIAPIVHGARGLCFYSVGMALRSGPVCAASVGSVQVPDVLTSWGPSPDGPDNVNMVSRVHNVVKALTGNQTIGDPDFLDILINDSDYTLIDGYDAYNASDSQGEFPVPNSESINFISFEENLTGDIYLIVSRDYDDYEAPWIVFDNTDIHDYGAVVCYGGWDPNQYQSDCTGLFEVSETRMNQNIQIHSRDVRKLAINFFEMPLYSASLLRIPKTTRTGSRSIVNTGLPILVQHTYNKGSVEFEIMGCTNDSRLDVYDVSGRLIRSYDVSEFDSNQTITLSSPVFNAGLYLVILKEKTEIVQLTKVSIF